MPRITRYVLLQLLMTFVITLTGITLIMVFGFLAKKAEEQGLGLDSVFRLLPYVLPTAMRFSIPATILMATCTVFGRMSADNEVVALKSLGIPPSVLIRPALGLAFAISLGVVWLNDVAVTWGADGIYRVAAESVEQIVFRLLKTQRSYSNSNFSINVMDVQGERLIHPTMIVRTSDHSRTVLEAREARLKTNMDQQTLSIFLTDCTIDDGDGNVAHNPDVFEGVIPLSKATRKEREERRVSELALAKITEEAISQENRIRELEQQMAARAAYQMILGDFAALGPATWSDQHKQLMEAHARLNRLRLEPWRRFAEAGSCFFIVMVGAPLAIRMRSSNVFTTFATCFFPILCVYYPILMWAVEQAKDGAVPPYTVWTGNLALMALGLWHSRAINRY